VALPQYDVSELLENIKRRATVPTSQLTYTYAGMTALANDELQGEVVPLIMSTREEYFVYHVDVQTAANGVIDFPANTVGSKLRSVCYFSQNNPLVIINLPRISLDVVAGMGFYNSWTLAGFYIEGSKLYLYPNTAVPTGTTIRLYFYKRALVLAPPREYGQVTAIDTGTNTLTLSQVPSDWVVGTELNSVLQTPNFETTAEFFTIQSISSPSITVDSVDGISVGDYISQYGYSAIPQIPLEAHAYLAQLTAAKALEGLSLIHI
jgi:hypothetical protein